MAIPTLLTVNQFSEAHPAFTCNALRALIFASKSRKQGKSVIPGNGMDVALVRIGRKILINEAKFFEWVERGAK